MCIYEICGLNPPIFSACAWTNDGATSPTISVSSLLLFSAWLAIRNLLAAVRHVLRGLTFAVRLQHAQVAHSGARVYLMPARTFNKCAVRTEDKRQRYAAILRTTPYTFLQVSWFSAAEKQCARDARRKSLTAAPARPTELTAEGTLPRPEGIQTGVAHDDELSDHPVRV